MNRCTVKQANDLMDEVMADMDISREEAINIVARELGISTGSVRQGLGSTMNNGWQWPYYRLASIVLLDEDPGNVIVKVDKDKSYSIM